MIRKVFFLLGILPFLIGCDNQRVFEANTDIPNAKWPKDEKYSFDFRIDDPAARYNLYYYVRSTVSYPFYNLYLKYTLSDANGKTISTQLQNMHLFDEKSGEPLGNGLGDLNDLSVLSIESLQFPDTGRYVFSIQQYMRRDTLNEVLAIGVRVETSEE